MTEIMPFPENNILFYWAAPHAAVSHPSKPQHRVVYFCFEKSKMSLCIYLLLVLMFVLDKIPKSEF